MQKRDILHQLIDLVKQGYDITPIVGPEMAMKIKEIVAFKDITEAEIYIKSLLVDWKVDEEEININKAFKQMDVDSELEQMKKDLGIK